MNFNIVDKNDEIVMALIHYFITEENYTPIVVKGVKDEVWLENIEGPYRIIRINSNYIHNEEQYKFDIFKTSKVIDQIRKKTLCLNMNTLNILLNVSDSVSLEEEPKNIESIKISNIHEIEHEKNISELFPKIKNKLIKDKEGIDLVVNVTTDINAKTARENEAYAKIFEPKKIVITPILITICVIMFILMYILGNGSEDIRTLLLFGANYKPLVQAGQVWRLLSSIFLHIGIIHLLVNMYSLFIIGRQLENFLGKWKYLIVFIGSGIIGSLLSAVVHTSVSAGASGAIFGLLGSLLYFGYHYRLYLGSVLRTQVIPVILLNLIIGFMMPGIDNFAHIGGLVGGIFLTMALGVPGKSKKSDRINGSIVLILLVAFFKFYVSEVLIYGKITKVIANSGVTSRRKAEELITQGKVSVNGEVVTKLGTMVKGDDVILVNGATISRDTKKVYYILNKPRGVITSVSDEHDRPTVIDYIDTDENLSVGRLDYDTTGLLILTNDGELANILMHPSNNIEKTYIAKIEGLLNKEDIDRLKNGVFIDGRRVNIVNFKIRDKNIEKKTSLVEITIVEGRNHIVKKIFESMRHPVIRLSRIKVAFLDIKDLKSGEYRELSLKEVKRLYSLK